MSLWATLKGRLAGPMARLDAAAAAASLRGFEAATGRKGAGDGSGHIAAVDLAGLLRALVPHNRPVIEHHWATWCESCLEELPRIQRITDAVAGQADMISVSWERFDDDRAAPLLVAHVEGFQRAHALRLHTLIYTGDPEALFSALSLPVHTIPQTRVLDASGGVLRAFEGPLDDEDERAVIALIRSLSGPAGHAPRR